MITENHAATAAASLPAVLILGGEANALSVARDLARLGVTVHAVGAPDAAVRHSRHCRWIDVPAPGGDYESAWSAFLLGPASGFLDGAVVLACSDAGLQVLTRHRAALLRRFRLDASDPVAQLAVLDKLTTYEHALAAGVPTPGFWDIETAEQVDALRDGVAFPVMVKPRLSHLFEARFGRKHVVVDSFDALRAAVRAAHAAGTAVLLMEYVPGGDDKLCSYYTYLDDRSEPLFHFTKRIIRRYPAGMGAACYHVTDWVPEIVPLAGRLFKRVGLRGLANVEFKLDDRDGRYKVIECNARFTASNCLVSASGVNLARFVYSRIVGLPAPAMDGYRRGVRLWEPLRDLAAFAELRRAGRLSLPRWAASVLHRQTFPYFRWSDPMPALARGVKPLRRLVGGLFRAAAPRTPASPLAVVPPLAEEPAA
jgi:predicted ATP-grasp superfamily ATP-dependent carboligase